jgi:hypothetical protein
MNVDRAAVQRGEQERAARVTEERIDALYSRLFRGVVPNLAVAALRTENAALDLFRSADSNLLQVEILRVAVDNRWTFVVEAFIKVWDGEHPIAATVQELWNLTTGRLPT